MSQIATENLHVAAATRFINNIAQNNANTYLVIAHIDPWANEPTPDLAVDTMAAEVGLWRAMIGGKRITGNDMQLVIQNNTWVNNTPYSAYTDSGDFWGSPFYVLTSDFNVYKCLANNSGSNSTVQPTYTSVDTAHQEIDGYIWKYMFSLSTSDRQRYLNSNWIPVRRPLADDGSLQWQVQNSAVPGSINAVVVTNGGVGYNNVGNLVITISGDGINALATGNINLTSQTVSSITPINPGSGFHFGNVSISGGGGTGATANLVISPFQGHGYDAPRELGAANVMINISLNKSEGGLLSTQADYRQLALLDNPLAFGTTTQMSNSVFSQIYTIFVGAGFGDYIFDENVFQGTSLASSTFAGKVVNWDSSNNIIQLASVAGTVTSAPILGISSGISRFVINSSNPQVVPYSGQITYIENVSPIQRANNQAESISTLISF